MSKIDTTPMPRALALAHDILNLNLKVGDSVSSAQKLIQTALDDERSRAIAECLEATKQVIRETRT